MTAAHVVLIFNLISVLMLMGYRRGSSRYKPSMSALAYLLIVSLGGQAIDVYFRDGGASWWTATVSVLIAVAVVRARGNVSTIVRCGL